MPDGYVDCYQTSIKGAVSLSEYVYAFYTSLVFRPERQLIGTFLNRPASDAVVRRLADDNIETFSAWTVETRTVDELLLADVSGSTRSWLMVKPDDEETHLFFGSAIVARDGKSPSVIFDLLSGFHTLYSRALLKSAYSALARDNTQ